MKGLLKNNLYAALSNAKIFSGFMILFGIFAAAVVSQSLQIGYVMIGIIGFSVSAIAAAKNELAGKTDRYYKKPVLESDDLASWGNIFGGN